MWTLYSMTEVLYICAHENSHAHSTTEIRKEIKDQKRKRAERNLKKNIIVINTKLLKQQLRKISEWNV